MFSVQELLGSSLKNTGGPIVKVKFPQSTTILINTKPTERLAGLNCKENKQP